VRAQADALGLGGGLRDDALDVGRGQGDGRAGALERGPEPRSRAQQKADEKSPIQIRGLAQWMGCRGL
jgi:hypothetical protein